MSVIALVLILFAATALLRLVADRYAIPLPALLVLGGLALALTPGLPRAALDPAAIFLLFVPPLLYWAALTTSLRDLLRNLRAILLLAVGLVLATMCVVALSAHALIPSLPWPVCFLLGAIVSPPDAVAVTAATRQLRLPRDLLVVLEGESLINDATALVAYQIALTAALHGRFSLPEAGLQLVLTGAGGIAIGLAIGWLIGQLRERIAGSSVVENTISLLSPFIAYMPANALGTSGVLAVVAAGLYLGRRAPHIVSAQTRLQANGMWAIVTFLLEGLIFIFIGLELPAVIAALDGAGIRTLIRDALLISAVMIGFRLLWIFPGAYLPRYLDSLRHRPVRYPPWRAVLFTGWAGLRGGDSLVIALALPYVTASGARLPGRAAVIFITFVVILVTLVVQGFTLAPAIRLLRLRGGGEARAEEHQARLAALQAGVAALEHGAGEPDVDPVQAQELRRRLELRLERLRAAVAPTDAPSPPVAALIAAPPMARLRLAVVAAQRQTIVALRDRGVIGDDVMRRLQAELDHEEVLLDRSVG
jgi:CPA1 family monovalent cation:H+ antiporter